LTSKLDKRSTLVYIVAGAAVTGSAWISFVPDWLSGFAFGSILAVAIAVVLLLTVAVRSIGSSPPPVM